MQNIMNKLDKNTWINTYGSGILKYSYELGMATHHLYLEERVSFTYGKHFQSVSKTRLTTGVPLVALSLNLRDTPYQTVYSSDFRCPGGKAEVYNFPYMEGKKLYIKGIPMKTYTYVCTIDFVDTNIQIHLISDCPDGSLRIVRQPHMTIGCAWHNRLGLEKQRSEWT